MEHLCQIYDETDPPASNVFAIGGTNTQGVLQSGIKPTAENITKYMKAVKDELGPDVNTLAGLLRDYELNRINAASLKVSVSILFANRPDLRQGFLTFLILFANLPDLRQGFLTFLNYQVEHSSTSNPNTKSTTHPVASGPPTLTQTAQGTSVDDSEPQQPMDTQQHDQPLDMLTTMHPCSMSPPTLQWLALSVQPPALTRPRVELFPPPVARLLKTNIDMREVYAIATLHSRNGSERQEQVVRLCSNGIFCFSGIKAPEEGVYTFRVTLVYGCHVVEYVDSNEIHSIPRPTGDVIPVQDTRKLKRQLLYLNEITYTGGYIGFFPNRKIYAGSMIYLGRQKYMKVMVLIPGSELIVGNNDVNGFCNARDGLSVHEDGNWYDDGEIEWADSLDATIHLGEDGEMYRQRMDGIFQSYFVALERRVSVVDAVTYIAHIVLYLE